MTEKEIILAMSFNKAPEDVQTAIKDIKAAYVRINKADGQLALWSAEKKMASSEMVEIQKKFDEAFSKWNPAKEKKLEQLPEQGKGV